MFSFSLNSLIFNLIQFDHNLFYVHNVLRSLQQRSVDGVNAHSTSYEPIQVGEWQCQLRNLCWPIRLVEKNSSENLWIQPSSFIQSSIHHHHHEWDNHPFYNHHPKYNQHPGYNRHPIPKYNFNCINQIIISTII